MTIEQLQILQAIVQYKTFTEAALALHLSQSVVSKQIAKLEREVGVSLFDRSHRQVQLTKIGTTIYHDAEKLLHEYQQLQQHLQAYHEQNHKTLRIAMLPILYQYNFAKRIAHFTQENPDIDITITEFEERDIYHGFPMDSYDIFILRNEQEQLQNYQSMVVYQDVLCAIVSNQHPLSHSSTLHIQQLKQEKLLLPPAYTSIVKLVRRVCEEAGFLPQIHRYGRIESILAATNENEGIALVMEHSLHMFHLPDVQVLSFTKPIHADIAMYYAPKKLHKESVQKFLALFQEQDS